MSSTIDRVLSLINQSPQGITSSMICDLNPDLNRGTVTSAVSKLKHKGVIRFNDKVPPNQPLLLYPLAGKPSGSITKLATKPAAETPARHTIMTTEVKQHILSVLQPFAKYAEAIRKNKPTDKYVWLSATTATPTVEVAAMDWFLDAQKLFMDLQK